MIYQVQDPNGQIHDIEGPDGASPEDVMKQAQSLIPEKPGVMDIFPQMLKEASGMGAPNIAQKMAGDAFGVEKIKEGPIGDPKVTDRQGLEDVTISDALTAAPMVGGAGKFLEPQLGRIARNQTMKSLGGSMKQIREMAKHGGLDESAAFARDKGLTDVFSTSLGREKLVEDLTSKYGKQLGDLRTKGGMSPLSHQELESKVMTDPGMQKFLGEGLEGGQKGDISKALNDVKRISGPYPTYSGRANAATEINQSIAGNKEYQPQNAATGVANILSRENNAGLAQALGPKDAAIEASLRKDFSSLKPIQHLQDHGELKEMRGAGGIKNALESFLPTGVANRAAAQGAAAGQKIAGAASNAPDLATTTMLKSVEEYLRNKFGGAQ